MIKGSVMRLKSGLVLTAAPLALAGLAFAQNAEPAANSRFVEHSWSVESSIFSTDNFRRLSDEAIRFDFSEEVPIGIDPESGGLITSPLVKETPVTVDPPSNTIVTGTVSGSTLIRRPAFAGLISGSVTVGSYVNTDDLDDRLLASASPAPLDEDLFDVPGADDPVSIGVASSTFGLPSGTDAFVEPNIRATGTLQLAENLLYVDGNALIQQQNLGTAGFAAQEGVGQSGDQITYGGFSISPYLLRRFGNESSLELRLRATAIEVLSEDSEQSVIVDGVEVEANDLQLENDGRSVEALAEYQSGDLFDRISFKIGAFFRDVTEDGSDLDSVREVDFNQGSGSLDVAYGVNRTFSLTAGVGVDEVDFASLEPLSTENPAGATDAEIAALDDARALRLAEIEDDEIREDELSGAFWRVGFRYVPSRQTELGVSIGERFGDTSVEIDGRYQPSPRITFSVRALRQLDSGLQDFASSSFQLQGQAFSMLSNLAGSQSPTANALLDRALSFEGSSFRDAQRGQFGVSAFDRVRLGARADFKRTNISGGISFSDADQGSRQSSVLAADAAINRQISRRLSGGLRVRYSLDDGDFVTPTIVDGVAVDVLDPFESQETFASVNLAYQIGQKLSLTGQVYRVERESEGNARGTQLDYIENAAGIGLRWVF